MSKDPFQLVSYKSDSRTFEVLVKPGVVPKWRETQMGSIDNIVFSDEIFTNYKKGDKAKESELQQAFQTTNTEEILKKIVMDGEYHFSAAERKAAIDKKRAEIINYIHKYFVDPKTKTPHPVTRIELAFDQIKYNIDPNEPAQKQVTDHVYKLIVDVIPLKKQEIDGEIFIKHQYVGMLLGGIKKLATIKKENYDGIGAHLEVNLIPGDYAPLLTLLENTTKGDFEFSIYGASTESEAMSGNAKKKAEKAEAKKGKKGK